MKWVNDDGGRAAAGYKGTAGDCVCRAVAIVTGLPYQEVYDKINVLAERERPGAKRRRGKRSTARDGVFKGTSKRLMEELGFKWTPTMQIGSGCKVHLRAEELPKGRLVVSVSKHLVAVIDGVIHDTHDPGRDGTRCVYGYWTKEAAPEEKPEPPTVPAITLKTWRHFVAAARDAAKMPCHRSNCGTVCLCMSCHARKALEAIGDESWRS